MSEELNRLFYYDNLNERMMSNHCVDADERTGSSRAIDRFGLCSGGTLHAEPLFDASVTAILHSPDSGRPYSMKQLRMHPNRRAIRQEMDIHSNTEIDSDFFRV